MTLPRRSSRLWFGSLQKLNCGLNEPLAAFGAFEQRVPGFVRALRDGFGGDEIALKIAVGVRDDERVLGNVFSLPARTR